MASVRLGLVLHRVLSVTLDSRLRKTVTLDSRLDLFSLEHTRLAYFSQGFLQRGGTGGDRSPPRIVEGGDTPCIKVSK